MEILPIFEQNLIHASGVVYGPPVPTGEREGYFSLVARLRGGGIVRFTYQASFDGEAWATPQNAPDILSGVGETSGPGGDGLMIEQFHPKLAPYIRIVATETGGVSAALLYVALAMK